MPMVTRISRTFMLGALLLAVGVTAINCNTVPPEQEHFGLAEVYHRDGRLVDAEVEYQEVLTIKPDCAEVMFNMAMLAYRRGDTDRALELLGDAIENYPRKDGTEGATEYAYNVAVKVAQAHQMRGYIYFQRREFQPALAAFSLAAEYNPNDHLLQYNVGITNEAMVMERQQAGMGEIDLIPYREAAITAYNATLSLKRDFPEAHLNLAFLYEEQGNITDARTHHSLARQAGMDSSVLTERLDRWADWRSYPIPITYTSQGETFSTQAQFDYPPTWVTGPAARVGAVAEAFADTQAVASTEQHAAVQFIGPFLENFAASRRFPDQDHWQYAQGQLEQWLRNNLEALYNTEGDMATDGMEWQLVGTPERFVFDNSTPGMMQECQSTSRDGREYLVTVYYYLGDTLSYVVVTTSPVNDPFLQHVVQHMAGGFQEVLAE